MMTLTMQPLRSKKINRLQLKAGQKMTWKRFLLPPSVAMGMPYLNCVNERDR